MYIYNIYMYIYTYMYYKYMLYIIYIIYIYNMYIFINVEGGGQEGYSPLPMLGTNSFHSGKFSEKTIGTSDRKFTEGLQPPK